MNVVLDFGDKDIALKSLTNFLNLEEYEVEYLAEMYKVKENIISVLQDYIIDIDSLLLKLESSKLVIYHTTSSIDQCKSLKEKGLQNTNTLLSNKNSFTSFLKEHGISIDVDEKSLTIDSTTDSTTHQIEEFNEKECESSSNNLDLYFKLYKQYHICGFFHRNQGYDYSSVKDYPETLEAIENFCCQHKKNKNLISSWEERAQTGIKIKIEEDFKVFSMDKFCDETGISPLWEDLLSREERLCVLNGILSIGFSTLFNEYNDSDADLHLGHNVPPENITIL